MKIITAPENYCSKEHDICVFLAGGITNCHNWQDKLINKLNTLVSEEDQLVVFNPRRENFPVGDPKAGHLQIAWEYKMLEKADIFSMYFCGGESDQPICMYELGRNILRMQMRFPSTWDDRIIISVENDYKRKADVTIQTKLATHNGFPVNIDNNIDRLIDVHAHVIYNEARYLSLSNNFT